MVFAGIRRFAGHSSIRLIRKFDSFMTPTSKKQVLTGLVISDKMDKTVVVKVDERKRHAKYHKSYTVSKKFKAHDENNEFHTGDTVSIESTRPISKDKKFKVISKTN
jgi:small subunit ribosomal protein S17